MALITINRPEARNAINGVVASGLQEAVERLERDPRALGRDHRRPRPGVLRRRRPQGDRGRQRRPLATEPGGFAGITRLIARKPLIAAVDGPALAGGCEIVCTCDLVVASTAASFGIPEVKRSLVAGAGGLFRLPRVLPRNVAMELAITGDPITAERAYGLGLVNALCEPGDAVDSALALAERVCVNAPIAVQLSRAIVLDGMLADDAEAWRMTDAATAQVMATEDFSEGPRPSSRSASRSGRAAETRLTAAVPSSTLDGSPAREKPSLRNPVRSEADAFHIVLGSGVVIAAAVVLGAVLDPLVGVALFAGALAGALIWELATSDPDRRRPLSEAEAAGRQNATRGRCLLVVANRTLASETLRSELVRRARSDTEVHFIAPILASRIHYIASDVDRELADARDRLADVLAWAESKVCGRPEGSATRMSRSARSRTSCAAPGPTR